MEFWKLKKIKTKVIFCFISCSIMTVLIFTLACKLIGADVMEFYVPMHIMKIVISNFYPEIIIDGEMAYNVLMYDSFIFYGSIIFLSTLIIVTCPSAMAGISLS